MTRQLVDALWGDIGVPTPAIADAIVASLLTDGPAEHTIDCPTCDGNGEVVIPAAPGGDMVMACPDCTNGRLTVTVSAEVKRNEFCNHEWRGPRGDVPFVSADVNHVCIQWKEPHPANHVCACHAWKPMGDTYPPPSWPVENQR